MIDMLVRYCLKQGDPNDGAARARCGTAAGWVGVGANAALFLAKLLCGVFTGSVAMTADAVNNLSDAAASLVTLVGFRLAGQEADADHPFGHGRMEYVSGLMVSIAILLMGFELLRSSLGAVIHPVQTVFSLPVCVILLLAIGIKLFLWRFDMTLGRRIGSPAVLAAGADALSDCAATGAVLLAAVLGRYTHLPVDGIAGAAVSCFIFKAGWEALRDTLDPLLGRPMDPELAREIDRLVRSHDYILGVHDLIWHDYGPGRAMMSFHAEVPADGDLLVLHDMIDHIERELKTKYRIDTVIHMDPVVMDGRTARLREQVEELVRGIDPALSVHDFRTTAGPLHTKLIFDVVLPYGFRLSADEVRGELMRGIGQMSDKYFPVIQIDRGFVE